MSLGASKLAASTAFTVTYNSFCTPSFVRDSFPNGGATSVLVTGNVTGGIGPFTYQWTKVSGDDFTINFPTDQVTSFTTSGFNQTKEGIYKFTVTDTGNGNLTSSANVQIEFNFGFA